MESWRLLITPDLSGALNMAIDATIANFVGAGASPPTLRFYDWQPYCLSLGYHQNITEVDRALCNRNRIDIVRRPTGGRAVYHAEEFTYAVILPKSSGLFRESIWDSYLLIAEWLLAGLAHFSVTAKLAPKLNIATRHNLAGNSACFSSASDYEILLDDKKLIGSAQRRWPEAVLQHGSILLGEEHLRVVDFLSLAPAERLRMREFLRRRTTVLRPWLEQPLDLAEFARELGIIWQRQFGVEVHMGELSEAEQNMATQRQDEFRFDSSPTQPRAEMQSLTVVQEK